jgi:two-component system, chemotaxis family, chemotaxis protein CheY
MLSHDAPILLVDDSMAIRQTVQKALNSAGYTNIDVASNGNEALDKIKDAITANQLYKIIFLDWKMPDMDGLAFLKICRSDLNLKDVAIIMLTAVTDQKSLILAMGSGATSFMIKPTSAEAILKKVEQVGNWIEAQGRDA